MSLWHPILRAIGDMLKSDYDPDADGIIEPPQVDDATKVEGEASGLREEHGVDVVSMTAGTGGSLFDQSGSGSVTISFATAFAVVPAVVCTNNSALERFYAFAYLPSTSSFVLFGWNNVTVSKTKEVGWVAIGS